MKPLFPLFPSLGKKRITKRACSTSCKSLRERQTLFHLDSVISKFAKIKSFSPFFSHFKRHLYIASHPAVDNEGEVVSYRNVIQRVEKNGIYFGLVWAKTTESELMGYSNALWCKPSKHPSKSKTIYMSRMLILNQSALSRLQSATLKWT